MVVLSSANKQDALLMDCRNLELHGIATLNTKQNGRFEEF